VNKSDFDDALRTVRSSVSVNDLESYRVWNSQFGSWPDAQCYEENE